MSFELRGEFFNIFNRTEFNNQDSTNAVAPQVKNAATGIPTSGFDKVNPVGLFATPRSGQIVAR